MKCPKCGSSTAIYGTKTKPTGTVLRYRRCLAQECWLKFQTTEAIVPGEGFYCAPKPCKKRRPTEQLGSPQA